jgi:LPS-assembly protein
MHSRWSRPAAALAACVAVLASPAMRDARAAAPGAEVAGAIDDTLPAPNLKFAPDLVPPAVRPASRAGARPAANGSRSSPQVPAAPLKIAPFGAGGGAIFVRADSISGVPEKFVEASGRVELRARNETVLADWLRYDFAQDEIWGKGNVLLRKGLDWITGPEARFRRDRETGSFTAPKFYVAENGSRGEAAEIRFAGPDRYEVTDARYTTCVAPREDWYIHMDELEIDKTRMVGTGHHATVRFFGVPIVYSPWLEFPLSNERKSGFLTPTFGSSSIRGFDAAMPYYLNLAPNYDATLAPRVMTKRGFQLGAQFRYLLENGQGGMEAEDLPHDRVTGTDRYALSWKHTQNLGSILPGLAGFLNLNKVSDDTYFSDLSDRVAFTSLTTLVREGGFTYANGPWQLRATAQAFQTLQDPTAPPVVAPYNRVPQIFGLLQETDWMGLTFAGVGEYADFRQPTLTTGQRAYLWPTVAWSRQGAAWSFTARTGAHLRQYNLNDVRPGVSSSQDYAIPITSVDGSLVFEREWDIAGRSVVQTLEPRAFYVYVPYRNQNDAPVFDTALDDFNFGQLFSVNRYLGNDRIADANQLTLALSSRFIDAETGIERLRVAVGERFYFQDQRVTLNESPRSASTSDFLLGFEGRLSEAWSLVGLWQYNFDASQTERVNAGVRYTPGPGRALNATYSYSGQYVDPVGAQSPLNQWDLSAQWPLDANWTVLGRWNYSVLGHKTLEAVAGVEYNAGCWVLRLVGQRLTTTTQTTSNSIYLQLELNGLARIGTSPLDLLRRSVPGYLRTNDPTVSPRERDDYFPAY